jgi:hypothetical protein
MGEGPTSTTGRQKMFTKWLVAVVIALSGLLSQGQDLKAITRHYKPNDTLRYRVEFDGDPKFDSVNIGFYLQGSVAPDQPGLQGYFSIGHTLRVKAGVFDVDGVIPPNVATGTFEVRRVSAALRSLSKDYDANSLHITIQVENDARYNFPPLKSVTPE